MIVTKFGGTSMADASQIKKACAIQASDNRRLIMVVSAPGKRFEGDEKVTDLLIDLAKTALAKQDTKPALDKVVRRYGEIVLDLGLDGGVIKTVADDLTCRLQKAATLPEPYFMDLMKAAGEDNCAKLVAAYLESAGVDACYLNPNASGMILSDEAGNARILPQSYVKLSKLAKLDKIGVFPGYFGYTQSGEVVTFARGGSDITGAILAAAVKAEEYENFTDVDGVFAAHPKMVKDPVAVDAITYREMRELAYAGFNVLHEESVEPVFRAHIPIRIKNVNNPDCEGTRIVHERNASKFSIVGIAGTKDFCIVNVWKFLMNREIGFGRKLFQLLEEEGISFDHAPSGIDNISPIIRQAQLTRENVKRLENRITKDLGADSVVFNMDIALIMLVGEKMFSLKGTAARATNALASNGINIAVLTMGGNSVSLTIGVDNKDLEKATNLLYQEFFQK
jgi:aspartate kinase